MNKEVVILLAEDDAGHAGLIRRNLRRAGIANPIVHFEDGQATMDFLFRQGPGPHAREDAAYILLLDIRMPKVDGTEVLKRIKSDPKLRAIPVIVITTTDDPRDVERCHMLGCNNYITKPVEYETFMNAIRQLGLFLMVVQVPTVNREQEHD
ncbi:MAG TPA: response regulator [Candidatus Hydrogenedentes bacterium]|nr:response regulator [Candidatus Hydrogenedentota bacterium]HPG68057.1 response regulator [Candidatus Hydrogenedentota bacterium]